jgi:hypothetical protein
VDDLVGDPADGARHHRPRLPHRLGDGEPEALGEALLHDDRRVALQRVDDERILDRVVHRNGRKVDARTVLSRELTPHRDRLVPDPEAFGVVADAVDCRPREDEVCAGPRVDGLGEPAEDARHVLHPVPAGDLDDERRVG